MRLAAPKQERSQKGTLAGSSKTPLHALEPGGIIVDKEDGHHQILGSGLALEEWLYAHEKGFRHRRYSMRILKVHQPFLTARVLSQMGYRLTEPMMKDLPLELPFGWMQYRHLPQLASAASFDYEFRITECDNEECSALGSLLPALAPSKSP